MNYDATLINYFFQASLVVKCVMVMLAGASILSWTYILQRIFYLGDISKSARKFENEFWSGEDLSKLYIEGNRRKRGLEGLEAVFNAGFKEYLRFRKQTGVTAPIETVVDNVKRAMRVVQMREQDKMEKNLQFLAMVSSTSPYIGLFGTVWGIMQAFRALSSSLQQATIAMVAPGIAEALIATALGLFAAIPAVIAYNRFVADINRLLTRFDGFQEEFTNIIVRQAQQSQPTFYPPPAENTLNASPAFGLNLNDTNPRMPAGTTKNLME